MTNSQKAPEQETEPREAPAAPADEAEPVREAGPRPGRPTLWVLGLTALAALGGVLYSLYRLTGMADGLDQTGVMILALSLFSPIIVAAYAGAVAGLVAPRLVKGPRKAVAALGFTVTGLATATAAYLLFQVDGAIALTLGLILLGSALAGGLIALPRHPLPVAAGLWATLLLLVFMFARGLLESSIELSNDPLEEYGILGRYAPFLMGLVCGLCAFLYLWKRKGRTKMLGYLLAGALPGGIWLACTVVAQIGVEVLIGVGVDELSFLDEGYLALAFQTQYNGSMTAMFVGAFCSVLAYGLLLPKPPKAKAAKSS
ncbi:hypothetical protein LO763_24270 [Glycomyces sp. A-F 0318]|uniref:hypothetical protein n=1 Tax=Glycomyces amatae TaxID=2881355 RepID=UPI001E2D3CAA|nr:hypothetical protein [Glycomyces amatae]MCD0446739.1 hypothetical protein [Glycomyces amatae]